MMRKIALLVATMVLTVASAANFGIGGKTTQIFDCGGMIDMPRLVKESIQTLTNDDFATYTSKGAWVVYFSAQDCPPCKVVKPMLSHLATKMPEIQFAEIDGRTQLEATMQNQVSGFPTIILFRDGFPLDIIRGSKSFKEVESRLEVLRSE
jgi:thioredoxin-like negative regulator of GroEL